MRLAERRQQRLREVQAKRDHLCEELAETQGRLMVEPGRWLDQCECPTPATAGAVGPPDTSMSVTPDPRSCPGSPFAVLCVPTPSHLCHPAAVMQQVL